MKKLISAVMIMTLFVTISIPAFGGEKEERSLEEALIAVKKVIDIPEGYVLESSDAYEHEEGKGNRGILWSLFWSNEKEGGSIYASIDWLGNLTHYSFSQERPSDEGLATVDKKEALAIAEGFLAKVIPEHHRYMKPVNEDQITAGFNSYDFEYILHSGDIPLSFIRASVSINKFSGQVQRFDGFSPGQKVPRLKPVDISALIDEERGQNAYLEGLGPELVYSSHYDYKTKALKVFLAYRPQGGDKAVDAASGRIVKLSHYGYGIARNLKEEAVADTGAGGKGFSPSETAAIDQVKGLISKEDGIKAVQSLFPLKSISKNTIQAELTKSIIDKGEYTWNLVWDEAYAAVSAVTGEVVSFWRYGNLPEGHGRISREKAREKAEGLLKEVSLEKFEGCIYKEEEVNEDGKVDYHTFRYVRQVNGIEYEKNGLEVTVSAKDGSITSYNRTWYANIDFPDAEGAIGIVRVFETMDTEGDFNLVYRLSEAGDPILVYDFRQPVTGYYFDGNTGRMMDGTGEPAKKQLVPEYTDIQNHWCKKMVETLKENGYYLDGEKFNPDHYISQMDFLKYLYTSLRVYYNDEEFIKMLRESGILKGEETATKDFLSRQDGVKYAIRFIGLGKAGELPEIYRQMFKDTVSNDYKGYVAIAYGLGIIQGDSKGYFNGEKVMTNGEAAAIIYNLLRL
ncbi:MAG: YcdB/YcdC domain-containing protein [Anaerovoracaceae bacterium]